MLERNGRRMKVSLLRPFAIGLIAIPSALFGFTRHAHAQ